MASMAIDIVDRNWRLLQGKDKPCTPRAARQRRCNPSRARGDNCYERERWGKGHRAHAMERVLRRIDRRRSIDSILDQMNEAEVAVAENVAVALPAPKKGRALRVFDPALEARRDDLRCQIRSLEIEVPFTRNKRERRRLERKLARALGRLRKIETVLRVVS